MNERDGDVALVCFLKVLILSDDASPNFAPSRDIRRLIDIMAALRDPISGCPWDVRQNFATIAPYTLEEAYEVVDAIDRGDWEDLREELGDLLLQVAFHARLAEEEGLFDFGGVVQAITEKLIRRHPHVFGEARNLDAEDVKALWGRIKAEEKRERADARAQAGLDADIKPGALAGAPIALPALTRALKLQEKAGKVGFDWTDPRSVIAKIREEIDEVEAEIDEGGREALTGEVGDLIFAAVNLSRHLRVDPETALRGANAKFERRFAHIERRLGERGERPENASLETMEAFWDEAKRVERGG